ncbi:MAG TPA: phage portal protein, partial [Vicinamibacterales bacterium]|nr:phage portal protein [Vicinamibacterales bacterium]
EAAARSVDQHNSAQDWNTAMFQNRAQPPGAFVVEGTLDDNEFDRVKAEVAEQYAGTSNARKPMLLEGGLDWKEMGLSPVEMDWLDGKRANAAEICAVFGVPPEMVGDSSGRTYSNYQEARKAFYMETVLPLLDHLRDDLNAWLTPRFGDNLYLDYDRDSIEALQDDRETLFGRAQAASFLTEDEKREMVGLPPLPNNVGEVVLRPTLTIAVPLTTATPAQAPAPGAKAWNLQTDEAKSAHWHATDALRTAWGAKVSEMIARRFTSEGDAVHGALAAHPDDALTYVDRAVDSKAWVDTLGVAYRAVMQDFGARVLEGLKAEAGEREWKAASESVEDWWSQGAEAFVQATVAQRVTGITETTKAVLAALVQEGIAAGESIPDIARRIRSTYESFSEARSTLIARTETIAASSAGSRYAAESTGLPLEHEWLATPDDRTRADHRKASGQRRPMAEPYEVGGYALMFPGDPTAPPSEVIQCRCAELFHVVS